MQHSSVILNRFFIKQLSEQERTVWVYTYRLSQLPEPGQEQRVLYNICYQLRPTLSVPMGTAIVSRDPLPPEKLAKGEEWVLSGAGCQVLNPRDPEQLSILEKLERSFLKSHLEKIDKTALEKAAEGGFIWWRKDADGIATSQSRKVLLAGEGWEIHRGQHIDIEIDHNGNLYLEIDLHHRFYSPWTLQKWLENYPDIKIDYVRNSYLSKGEYKTWKFSHVSDQDPYQLKLPLSGMTLAEYHLNLGADPDLVQTSQVVYVKSAFSTGRNQEDIPHLSQRLSVILSMETLAAIKEESEDPAEKLKINAVFDHIRADISTRFTQAEKTAAYLSQKIYQCGSSVSLLSLPSTLLSPVRLLAKNGSAKSSRDVEKLGCVKAGEDKIGCLDLTGKGIFPEEVKQFLEKVARSTDAPLAFGQPRTQLPEAALERQHFWQQWARAGAKTILVVCKEWLGDDHKLRIRKEALNAGIATQFMIAFKKKNDSYKVANIALGLLVKAGWQPLSLVPVEHPQAADLIIGFDTGRNRDIAFGTAAFASLANGQSLGWELPSVQRGETIPAEHIFQTVSKLILRFQDHCQRQPKRVLLLRDGFVQDQEFGRTISALAEAGIESDLVGIRKSGAGRMATHQPHQQPPYCDASKGTVVYLENSFLLVTTSPISNQLGSVRPIRAVHYCGDTPLDVLATQIYHLSCLHPGSASSGCRLPWVLHLADRSAKEFQRLGQLSILENLNKEKLIAV